MSGVDVTHRLEVVRCIGKWVVRLQTPTDGAQGKKPTKNHPQRKQLRFAGCYFNSFS